MDHETSVAILVGYLFETRDEELVRFDKVSCWLLGDLECLAPGVALWSDLCVPPHQVGHAGYVWGSRTGCLLVEGISFDLL